MGRNKHCTPEKRQIMYRMYQNGETVAEIAEVLGCSRKMVYNGLQLVRENTIYLMENKKRTSNWRKTTVSIDRTIRRKSVRYPFKSSREIRNEINEEYSTEISSRTVRRRLNEYQLFGRISRRKPYLSSHNIARRLHFAREHITKSISFWKNVLWSDESKFNRLGPDGKTFVRRPKCEEFNPRYTKKTVSHFGGNIKVWGAFSWRGVGPIVRISGIMDQYQYLNILRDHMEPYAFESMPVSFTFMHDNDPKHTARTIKSWLSQEKVSVLSWPAQSPDLNPIENLWKDVKVKIQDKNFDNFDQLWRGVQEAWYSIPIERCQKLVESVPRRLGAVISNRGYSTKY